MTIKWKRGEGSYHDSKCGRFSIQPVYRSTVNPSGYKLVDKKTKQTHWVDRVKDAKRQADYVIECETNPPKMLTEEETRDLF